MGGTPLRQAIMEVEVELFMLGERVLSEWRVYINSGEVLLSLSGRLGVV